MMTPKVKAFLEANTLPTPFMVLDIAAVRAKYDQLMAAMADSRVYFAVKSNPAAKVLSALAHKGSYFDVASMPEVLACLQAGVPPERLSYGNTVKKSEDIAKAYAAGVRVFAFDSMPELVKLAKHAPGSSVFCRILVDNSGAEWPLSRKFGCDPYVAHHLLREAHIMGLVPYGVSFHVGSQQMQLDRWQLAIVAAADIFRKLKGEGIAMPFLNIGGGFPVHYAKDVPDIQDIGEAVMEAICVHFGPDCPEILATEPGRFLVAEAAVLRSKVILVSQKSHQDKVHWVYVDTGIFGGLVEATHIEFKVRTNKDSDPKMLAILAGPTCDSVDVLNQRDGFVLPATLEEGDVVDILAAGAYTASCATVNFNGFAPLKTYYLD
jgi:ornithine decarboxylase